MPKKKKDMTELAEHPIRSLIAGLLKDGKRGAEPAQLEVQALAEIRAEIRSHFGTPELVTCIQMVLAIAAHLQSEYDSPSTARALVDLTQEDSVQKALRELTRQRVAQQAEHLAARRSDFSGFLRMDPLKSAPRPNAKVPKNSVKVGSLGFPKRL